MTPDPTNAARDEERIDQALETLGYKVVPSNQVDKATQLIITYSERDRLRAALLSLLREARIDELRNIEKYGMHDNIGLYAYQVDKTWYDSRIAELSAGRGGE